MNNPKDSLLHTYELHQDNKDAVTQTTIRQMLQDLKRALQKHKKISVSIEKTT